jgi:outer membrane lipoprotein LolB
VRLLPSVVVRSRFAGAPLALPLSVLALLGGCVGTVRPPPAATVAVPPLTERRAALQAVQSFQLEGRLAAAVDGEGFNANLGWTQRGDRSELDLRAPLGFGAARVVRDAGQLTLEASRGERFNGPLASEQLAQRLGFEPPLGSLRWWVLGMPDPAGPEGTASLSPDGQSVLALDQNGWHVDYSEYARYGSTPLTAWLPRRLTLSREGVRLRLVVDRWQVPLP